MNHYISREILEIVSISFLQLMKGMYGMKKGIILYKSKYGATKKYVKWLSEETGYDFLDVKKANIKDLEDYELIIFCGAIYASGISGLSFLRKNISLLKDKEIVVFCVGASPYDQNAFDEMKKQNLKEDLKDIPVFYGRGTWNEEKMTFKDRTLCKLLKKSIAKKDPATYEPWMRALMSADGQNCDWTDQSYLKPLIAYIKE